MALIRSSLNPILDPSQIPPIWQKHEVIGVFNAAVQRVKQEVFLMLRVAERPIQGDCKAIHTRLYREDLQGYRELTFKRDDPDVDLTDTRLIQTPQANYLTSLSYLRLVRSRDGVHFSLDNNLCITPCDAYEAFGLEDPRWIQLKGRHVLTYVAVSPRGIVTRMATSDNGLDWQRQGIIFGPENKDVVLFPAKIDGYYYALHRPTSPFSRRNEMWIARSPDLMHWGDHRYLMGVGIHPWDSVKLGAGAPPVRTDQGWLAIYHGVDPQDRYSLGAVLLDLEHPWKVLARSRVPILSPEMNYECDGFWGQVVFTCGLLFEENRFKLYYGASDQSICYAEIDAEDVFQTLEPVDRV